MPRLFGLLFERHARAIYNCFRRTADWAVAEDLTSIVFLEAWRRRERELLPEKVLPWLYGIATNVIRNRRRSLRRHAAALGDRWRDYDGTFVEVVDEDGAFVWGAGTNPEDVACVGRNARGPGGV